VASWSTTRCSSMTTKGPTTISFSGADKRCQWFDVAVAVLDISIRATMRANSCVVALPNICRPSTSSVRFLRRSQWVNATLGDIHLQRP
jgi:hypothetical protein